ncbi:hypothetical protein BC835DRAFT_1410784 [Cytidiella melzeri]|nr:hypothetical protein BC835DRAFT_1410784 [Cytidiella melzeri]
MSLQADVAHVPFGNVLTELSRNKRHRALHRKLGEFRRLQRNHMPQLSMHVQFATNGSIDDGVAREPEEMPLCLPSDRMIVAFREQVCNANLLRIEEVLRVTLAEELLNNLCRHLRTRSFASKYKIENMVRQRANTCGRQWLATIDRRAMTAAKRYRKSRAALRELRGLGNW